jgi:hypothetical protein
MKIHLQQGLPFIQVSLVHRHQQKIFNQVLLDTGSAGTVVSIDNVVDLGLQFEYQDPVHRICGVGGAEFVFSKRVDYLALGTFELRNFEIEIGTLDYGLAIDGILGIVIFLRTGTQ